MEVQNTRAAQTLLCKGKKTAEFFILSPGSSHCCDSVYFLSRTTERFFWATPEIMPEAD